MKNLIIKFCRWALAALGLAGAASCDGGMRVEYGSPYCSYEVKCKVVDSETSKVVKGVRLTPGVAYTYTDESGQKVDGFYAFEDASDNGNGEYTMSGTRYDGDFREIHIYLTDPDPAADGHYKDSIYVVPLERVRDADDKEHWNVGLYAADVTIEAESPVDMEE